VQSFSIQFSKLSQHPDVSSAVGELSSHRIARAGNTTLAEAPSCLVMQAVTEPFSHPRLNRAKMN